MVCVSISTVKMANTSMDMEGGVPCMFCQRTFKSFVALGMHVKTEHAAKISAASLKLPDRKPADDSWEETGWFLGEELEEMAMLPQPGGGKTPSQRQNNRKGPNVPFLNVEDLTETPEPAKILAIITENTGYNDIIVKIQLGARRFFWGLKASNPNYETLFRTFGANSDKWVNEEISLGLKFNSTYEKNFVEIFNISEKKDGRKK